MTKRRDLLAIGGLAAVALAIPPYLRRSPIAFEFQPLADFPSFRRMNGGPISGGFDVFAGLDAPVEPHQPPVLPLCNPLFGPQGWGKDRLPIAVFGDVYCPNCVAFESRLDAIIVDSAPVRLIHHQLPLLGDRSVWAARVILAAGLQDADNTLYRDLLQRGLRPGRAALRDVADRYGLDAEQLWADATGPVVADLLGKALGLGSALGIPGTPSMVVGRTLVIGGLAKKDLIRLIDLERSEPFTGCAS